MEGGGEQQRYVRVICVNTVETWERHTRQTGGTTVPHSERDQMCMPYYQHVFKMCTNQRFSNQVSVPACLCPFADHMGVHHKYTELSTIQTAHSAKPVKMHTCRLVSDVGLRLIMYQVSKLCSIFSSILLKFKNKYIDSCMTDVSHRSFINS